mmetsp:Transcript_50876/g.99523  ORF Transcript_50876/g.99523 Transcript_50876/m.99523 type:complete len:113 (-) Transcript_50876:1631-1969(-)
MTRRTLGLRQICDLRECFGLKKNRDVEESETTDRSASGLSHVGKAAYGALKLKHAFFHHKLVSVVNAYCSSVFAPPVTIDSAILLSAQKVERHVRKGCREASAHTTRCLDAR